MLNSLFQFDWLMTMTLHSPESAIDLDTVWPEIRKTAAEIADKEKALQRFMNETVLNCSSLEEAVAFRLARKFGRVNNTEEDLRKTFIEIFKSNTNIGEEIRHDIVAIKERDPACPDYLTPALYYKGFQAITSYRISHALWGNGRRELAYYFESLINEVYGVDIHPAAKIGCGILLDHATSFVCGETALIEDNVSILHEVTLGGTGKEKGDRHPKVRSGVLIGAGAKLLGNINIGEGAKIGAGSVVLTDVPPHVTVAGVPARVVGHTLEENPAAVMDQHLECPDD